MTIFMTSCEISWSTDDGIDVEYTIWNICCWRLRYNFRRDKTMYESASKLFQMLRVENNLNKSGLPYVCNFVILMSLCPWRRFGETKKYNSDKMFESFRYGVLSFWHTEAQFTSAEKQLLIQTSSQSRTKFRIDWFLVTILFLKRNLAKTLAWRDRSTTFGCRARVV